MAKKFQGYTRYIFLISDLLHLFLPIFVGYVVRNKTWSRLKDYVLGPKTSDSSSKTTHIVSFPGLNSPIQIKIPQTSFFGKLTWKILYTNLDLVFFGHNSEPCGNFWTILRHKLPIIHPDLPIPSNNLNSNVQPEFLNLIF